MLFACIRADFLKTKRLSVRAAHVLLPVAAAVVFAAYYSYAPWSEYVKTGVYYQVLGTALPVLIGLFCTMLSEQEQSAGACQSMLFVQRKSFPFLSKLILLLLFGMGALFMASALFGLLSVWALGYRSVVPSFYLAVPFVLLGSSAFLYILHLYLAFHFRKGVSIGLGIVESLVSALFLTDMGKAVWRYVPAAWPARMADLFLAAYTGDSAAGAAMHDMIPVCTVSCFCAVLLYLIWASRWEGGRGTD